MKKTLYGWVKKKIQKRGLELLNGLFVWFFQTFTYILSVRSICFLLLLFEREMVSFLVFGFPCEQKGFQLFCVYLFLYVLTLVTYIFEIKIWLISIYFFLNIVLTQTRHYTRWSLYQLYLASSFGFVMALQIQQCAGNFPQTF